MDVCQSSSLRKCGLFYQSQLSEAPRGSFILPVHRTTRESWFRRIMESSRRTHSVNHTTNNKRKSGIQVAIIYLSARFWVEENHPRGKFVATVVIFFFTSSSSLFASPSLQELRRVAKLSAKLLLQGLGLLSNGSRGIQTCPSVALEFSFTDEHIWSFTECNTHFEWRNAIKRQDGDLVVLCHLSNPSRTSVSLLLACLKSIWGGASAQRHLYSSQYATSDASESPIVL